MQTAPERRSPQHARVPLDDVLVELFPEGFDEGFEADAVDLGKGGLSISAPLLPDIGSTLRCSFRSPENGQPVDADCEVVWAEDSGPTEGHFGLRFTQLPADSARAIGRIVDQWMEVLAEDEDSGPQMTSLALDGVRSPIVGEVAHRAHDALLMEQELPFLRIGTGVREGGQRQGRLASVDVRIENDIPRLVLTVLYEDSSPGVEEAQEFVAEVEGRQRALRADMPVDADRTFRQNSPPVMESMAVEHAAPVGFAGFADVGSTADDDEALARSMTPARDFATLWARVQPKLVALRVRVVAAWLAFKAQAEPKVRVFAARARDFLGKIRTKHVPTAKASLLRMGARVRVFVAALRARRAEAVEARSPRRTTRAPANAAHIRPSTTERALSERAAPTSDSRRVKNRRRLALLGVFALGISGTVWAFSGGEDAQATEMPSASDAAVVVSAALQPSVAAADAPDIRSPYAADEPAEPAIDPEDGSQVAAEEAPSAEPAQAAGRMDAPTFPSIGGAPSNADTATATRFGAEDVPRARDFTLRMSRRVQGIRGEALPDGFRVDVDGSLSLDRAGPIAAAHPLVERATVLNRGDHAELRIRFVSGRHPAYRVTAQGSAIVVSIGR